jgi:hypothetical protein
MKKLSLLILSLLPAMSFAQNANPTIEGVNYEGFRAFPSENCNFMNNSAYRCSQLGLNGNVLTTSIIEFKSQAELCNNLRNQSLNSVVSDGLAYSIAATVRNQYLVDSCSASQGLDHSTDSKSLLKTMTCRLVVEGIDGAKGDTGSIQIPISAGGMVGEIYATMIKEKKTELFSVTTTKQSTRYVRIQYRFSKDSKSETDQLSLIAKVANGATASIKGEARSGVALNIVANGDIGEAEVKCAVTDAISIQKETPVDYYSCNVSDTSIVGNYGTAAPITSLITNAIKLTEPDAQTNVTVSAEIPAVAIFSANLTKSGAATITAKANLNKRSEFKVNSLSKTVEIKCK